MSNIETLHKWNIIINIIKDTSARYIASNECVSNDISTL